MKTRSGEKGSAGKNIISVETSDPVGQVSAIDLESIHDARQKKHEFLRSGFLMADLSPVSLSSSAANRYHIKIDGAFFANIRGQLPSAKSTISCRSMVYVGRDVKCLFLSFDTMLSLGIICPTFPRIGMFPTTAEEETMRRGTICGSTRDDWSICSCPKMIFVPTNQKPYHSLAQTKTSLECGTGSTFNICPHQFLPAMTGPPIDIHIKSDAKSKACHTAA